MASLSSPSESGRGNICHAPLSRSSNVVGHDSRLFTNILPSELEHTVFQSLQEELRPLWSEMYHKGGAVPRLVCLQGDVICNSISDNNKGKTKTFIPLYRHPTDEQPPLQPWTPIVQKLRDIASNLVDGQELNHALIQLYRNGDDYISEHADKTLDIERGSSIVNLSIGATRTMILRPKKEIGPSGNAMVPKGTPRPSTRVKMDHASLFVLGWETNQRMTHEIKRDKRDDKFKTDHERAFDGVRISITLRKVATFLCTDDGSLVGQGAPNKAKSLISHSPASSLADAKEEEDMLLKAFSTENRRSDYDWEELYGDGFSVVNFRITNNQEESTTAGDANANENGTGSGSDVLNIDSAAVDPAQDDLVNVHMLSRC